MKNVKQIISYNKNNNIDFSKIEESLGFSINKSLKDFYNFNLFKTFTFEIDKDILKHSYNHGNWFEESDKVEITIFGNKDTDNFEKFFVQNFNQEVIYGSEIQEEKRYALGEIEDERGVMGLYFNNDTGEIEWYDYEWGADEWKDNPRGIISKSIKEFFNNL